MVRLGDKCFHTNSANGGLISNTPGSAGLVPVWVWDAVDEDGDGRPVTQEWVTVIFTHSQDAFTGSLAFSWVVFTVRNKKIPPVLLFK